MWIIVEPLLTVAIGLFILTQLVIPAFFGGRFFWIFRKNTRLLNKEKERLLDLKDAEDFIDTRKEADDFEKRLKRKAAKR